VKYNFNAIKNVEKNVKKHTYRVRFFGDKLEEAVELAPETEKKTLFIITKFNQCSSGFLDHEANIVG
jgi:hypothetical protein